MAITLEHTLTERFSGYLPLSYEVSTPIDGGLVVMWDPANPGKVKPCTAADAKLWLGVAKYFGKPSNEFEDFGDPKVRGAILNEPIPRVIACPHFGVYDLVNAGAVTVKPGMSIQVVDNEGRVGRLGTGDGTEPDARAVVGTVLGLFDPNNRGATNARPTPVGSKFRVRLGRG